MQNAILRKITTMSMQWREKSNPKGYQECELEEKHSFQSTKFDSSQKGKWDHKLIVVPNHSLVEYQTSTSNNVLATMSAPTTINSEGENSKSMCIQTHHSSYDSEFDYVKIKEKDLLLQFQLFGMSSIQCSFFKYGDTKVKP